LRRTRSEKEKQALLERKKMIERLGKGGRKTRRQGDALWGKPTRTEVIAPPKAKEVSHFATREKRGRGGTYLALCLKKKKEKPKRRKGA